MITCKFHGRLGNNLFQIATAIDIAKKLDTDFILPNISHQGHRGDRLVDISMFEHKFNRGLIQTDYTYNETEFSYKEIPLADNTSISGFFQSWKYFDDIRTELIHKYFKFNKEILESVKKYQCIGMNTLGISVRRGDYLMLQHNHCVLSTEYYQEAINKYFYEGIDSVYVFSDDIEWCKQIFGDSVIYVEDSIGSQLCLMTKMQNLILSNSTFAWWGAYLNETASLIVAPDPWFGPALQGNNTKDLFYPTWRLQKHNIVTHPYTLTENMFTN